MELWDAYDREGNRIAGIVLRRGEPIPDGVYHLVADVILRHSDGTYLLMRRDMSKQHGGGLWEATAGGSALAGEDAYACAMRELYEETGISVTSLTLVGTSVNEARDTLYREYAAETDCAKDAVRLQSGETMDYRWVTVDEMRAMRAEGLLTLRTRAYVDSLVN